MPKNAMPNWIPLYHACASWKRLASYSSESERRRLAPDLMRASPGCFALMSSEGRWTPAPHLALLDQTILESIDEAAAGRLDGLAVSMPPQHGKSELCSKYLPAWYLATHPDRRVLLASYEADFAASWGGKARDLLEEFGHLVGVRVSSRSKAVHRWQIAGRDGGMSTAGVGGPLTGKGAHLLIVDDPIKNDAEARSARIRQKQWEWWQSVASTRLRSGALAVVIQTRWHRDDLTGKILAQAAIAGRTWKQLRLTAIAEENDPLGRAPGEALWPTAYTAEKLRAIQAMRSNYYWRAMYQQAPITDGSTEWPDTWFGPEIWFDEWPSEWRCRVVTLDPSKGNGSKFGDYSAFVLLQVGADGRFYVDADLAVRNTQTLIEQSLEIQQQFVPDWFGVEVNQFQQLLADQMAQAARRRGMILPVYPIENHIPKLVRIRRLTPLLGQGLLRFKSRSPGTLLLVEQLRDFPHGDHDDGPDALEMAYRLATNLLAGTAPDSGGFSVERARS